jgi:hypothetical protein
MCCPPARLEVVMIRFQEVLQQLHEEIREWEEVVVVPIGWVTDTPESSDWGSDDDLADLPSLESFAN